MYSTSAHPLSQDQLELFCRAWAEHGSDDPTDRFFVLFDGGDAESRPEYGELRAIGRSCGLQMELRDGQLWVPKTQQIHDEIGANWI